MCKNMKMMEKKKDLIEQGKENDILKCQRENAVLQIAC